MVSKEREDKALEDMKQMEAELWDFVQNEVTNLKVEPLVVSACILKVAVAMYKDQLGTEYTKAILNLASNNIDETWSPGDIIDPTGQTIH